MLEGLITVTLFELGSLPVFESDGLTKPWTWFALMCFRSWLLICIQGSFKMSLAEILLSASLWKSFCRKNRAGGLTCSGNYSSLNLIAWYNSLSLDPLKGNLPQRRAKSRTPRAQMSAGGPEYSILATISGAMYEGVPQKSLIFFSWGIQVEKPKSISLTRSFVSSRRMFSSLISLCVTLR